MMAKSISCREVREAQSSGLTRSISKIWGRQECELVIFESGQVFLVYLSFVHAHRPDGSLVEITSDRRVAHRLFTTTLDQRRSGISVEINGSSELLLPGISDGLRFDSLEDFHTFNSSLEALNGSFLYSLPHPERFMSELESLSDSLYHKVGLEADVLDRSWRSILALDDAVRKLGGERCIQSDIFPIPDRLRMRCIPNESFGPNWNNPRSGA